jgi:quercetin dioxygenase-like cupin family protein
LAAGVGCPWRPDRFRKVIESGQADVAVRIVDAVEILDFSLPAGRPVRAHGSVGLTAQALVRSDAVAVTVLRVEAGGEIGRHPAVVDQLLVIVMGRAAVQAGDGLWQEIRAGQAAVWRAGEEHSTRAAETSPRW